MKEREECIFRGIIKHFSRKAGGLHVDWFDYRDVKYQYFLSHAHADHYTFKENGKYTGLLTNSFISELKTKPKLKIYCTKSTKDILLKRFKGPDSNIRELKEHIEILKDDEKREINLISKTGKDSGKKITVTTISANHILGAVMFLFEDGEKRALYTGDFRYDVREENEEMKQLKDFVENYDKVIDYLYVDITCLDVGRLCHPNQNKFPSRPEITRKVIELIKEQRARSIHIDVSPLGSESIVRSAAEFLNISVNSIEAESESMKEVTRYLLENVKIPSIPFRSKDSACVHIFNGSIFFVATKENGECSKCKKDTLRIRATLEWIFHKKDYHYSNLDKCYYHLDDDLAREDRDFWQVLYSNHSSDYELREFLSHLKFTEIFPINEPFTRAAWCGLAEDELESTHSGDTDHDSECSDLEDVYPYETYSESTDSEETEENMQGIIRQSLYFTLEADLLRCPSYHSLKVLWFCASEGDRRHQRDVSKDGIHVSVKYFRNPNDIFSAILNHKNPIDFITIPSTANFLQSLTQLLDHLFEQLSQNTRTCDSTLLFYSSTAKENNGNWKNMINTDYKENPRVNYIDLTAIPEFREENSLETHIILETVKNLARNRDKIMNYEDWPVPYEYSARKREYDLINSQQDEVQPETQKRSVTEVDEDSDERKAGNLKKLKGNSI